MRADKPGDAHKLMPRVERTPAPNLRRDPNLVSVIIPVYGEIESARTALTSALDQTYRPIEVIIVNDGCPNSVELEATIAPFRSAIRYVIQPHGGAGAARNSGIIQSTGGLIAFLDADDRWRPDFLAEGVASLNRIPRCDLVYCDALITGSSPRAGRRFMETSPSKGPVTLEALLLQRCNVITSCVLVRASALFEVGLFDVALRRGQDYDLWLRMAEHGCRFAYDRTVRVERTERSWGSPEESIADVERLLSVLTRFEKRTNLTPEAAAAIRTRIEWAGDRLLLEHAKRALELHDVRGARQQLVGIRRKSVKARAVLAALLLAPSLTPVLYRFWRHRYQRRRTTA